MTQQSVMFHIVFLVKFLVGDELVHGTLEFQGKAIPFVYKKEREYQKVISLSTNCFKNFLNGITVTKLTNFRDKHAEIKGANR